MRKLGRRTARQYNRHTRGRIPVPLSSTPPKAVHGTAAIDWSRLPADVLTSILCGLEFPDVFSSAAVCTSWLATARALGRSYTRPQSPCLFYATAGGVELYSLAAGKSFRPPELPAPPIADRYIWGSSHGWLATADARSELHLLNPATGEQLALPPVATIEQVNPVLDDAGELNRYDLSFYDAAVPRKETQPPQPYGVGKLREVLYLKVILSGDPSRDGNCTAMLIHNPHIGSSRSRESGKMSSGIGSLPRRITQSTQIAYTMTVRSTP